MCQGCNDELEVPSSAFRYLKFEQQLNIKCDSCDSHLLVIMRPMVKVVDSKVSHNKKKQADA